MELSKKHFKTLVKYVINEAATLKEMEIPISKDELYKQTPKQKKTVDALLKYGFHVKNTVPSEQGITVNLTKSSGRFEDAVVEVYPDGTSKSNEPDDKLIGMSEQSGTGAVGGYATPFAFTKNKKGSQRALDVSKRLGYTVVKGFSETEQ